MIEEICFWCQVSVNVPHLPSIRSTKNTLFCFLSPHGMHAEICRLLFLSVSEIDEIWQTNQDQHWWLFAQEVLLWHQNTEESKKKFCNAFLVHRLADEMKFGMIRAFVRSRSFRIWVNIGPLCGSTNFRQRISCTLLVAAQWNLGWLWVWPMYTCSPNSWTLVRGSRDTTRQYASFTDALVMILHSLSFKYKST